MIMVQKNEALEKSVANGPRIHAIPPMLEPRQASLGYSIFKNSQVRGSPPGIKSGEKGTMDSETIR